MLHVVYCACLPTLHQPIQPRGVCTSASASDHFSACKLLCFMSELQNYCSGMSPSPCLLCCSNNLCVTIIVTWYLFPVLLSAVGTVTISSSHHVESDQTLSPCQRIQQSASSSSRSPWLRQRPAVWGRSENHHAEGSGHSSRCCRCYHGTQGGVI